MSKKDNQVTGNIGLYYVCYQLSRLGWNVLPTSRNARGVDIVIYDQSSRRKDTIQIKSLSGRSPVPLGNNLDNLFADFLVIVRNVVTDSPEVFVAKIADDLKKLVHLGMKDGRKSYWFQPKDYEGLSRSLEQVIGKGG